MDKIKNFNLTFGVMGSTIKEQLKEQNLRFDLATINHYQRILEAIFLLNFNGIGTPSISKKFEKKLFKKILKHVQENNKD